MLQFWEISDDFQLDRLSCSVLRSFTNESLHGVREDRLNCR